jgi:hypothetical protein
MLQMIAAAGRKADPAEACPTIPQGMSFFIFFKEGRDQTQSLNWPV